MNGLITPCGLHECHELGGIAMEQKFYICEHCGKMVALVKESGVIVVEWSGYPVKSFYCIDIQHNMLLMVAIRPRTV